jgi:hypothetical protein
VKIQFLTVAIILAFAFTGLASAQEDKAQPDRWHGLVLDQSTPEDVIKLLGPPKKDGQTRVFVSPLENWLTKRCKEKVFRTLEFGKLEGIDKATLSFMDNRLVVIWLEVKKENISTNDLANLYGMSFTAVGGSNQLPLRPQDLTESRRSLYPPPSGGIVSMYDLVGISERSFVTAFVADSRVMILTLISRTLETHEGLKVLK